MRILAAHENAPLTPKDTWTRRHGAALLLLVAAAAVYMSTLSSFGMLGWDEAEYATLARSFLRGEGFTIGGDLNALRPPLLPLAGAASMWLRGDMSDRSAKVASVVLALLALEVVFVVATAAFDRTIGVFAAFLLATMPGFWTMTAQFLSELPFLACFGAAVIGFDLGLRRDPRWFWCSWIACALALLTRYTAVLFAPYVLLRLLIGSLLRRDEEWPRWRTLPFVVAPVVALALVAPWLVRQHWAFGDALIGFRQASQQLAVYMPGVSMPWHFYLTRLPGLLSPTTAGLMVIGVASAVWRRDGAALNCALVIAGVVLWFSVYRYKEMRLITSILPFAAVVAASSVAELPRGRQRLLLVPLVAAIFLWNHLLVRPVFARMTNGYPRFLEAMEFVRGHASPDAVILTASTPQTAWYADRRVVAFPPEEDLASALRASEWVVFTNFERGQPPYALAIAKKLFGVNAPDESVTFHGHGVFVLVARSDTVASRVETAGPSARGR
jgi:4-amino-4-deoxy-L-arabinose transferase-like glycosyltransferase